MGISRTDLQRENNGYWTNGRFDLIQEKGSYMKDYEKKMGIRRTGDQTKKKNKIKKPKKFLAPK